MIFKRIRRRGPSWKSSRPWSVRGSVRPFWSKSKTIRVVVSDQIKSKRKNLTENKRIFQWKHKVSFKMKNHQRLAEICWHFSLTFLCLRLCPWISYPILRYVKDTIRAPGPSGIAPMPSAGIFKRKIEKKSPREPDTTTSSSSSIGRPSGVFVHPSTGLREKFGLKPSKSKANENIRISFILNRIDSVTELADPSGQLFGPWIPG